ncbi:MAG TPA: transposase, partial [Syntrophobacteraceae bacterium]|nr:transposase [Syntrophobacteraceae bacterium]
SAVVEGINNQIKTLKRQAYGFRDHEDFKLRLYPLHAQRYSLAGWADLFFCVTHCG